MIEEIDAEGLGNLVIVDDNPNNLRVLSGILQQDGYKVRPALNGEIALRSMETFLPDLILLDIRMPGMDGYEVCRRLKEQPRTKDVPVIFISALQDTEDKVEAFRAGAVDYVAKPFQVEEVLARVRTHMKLSRMQQHLEQLVAQRTRELLDSQLRYQAVVDHAGEMILLVDESGRIRDANPMACHALGLDNDELTERVLYQVDIGLDEAGFRGIWSEVGQGRLAIRMGHYRCQNGGQLPVEASISALNIDGQPHLLLLARDITERLNAEIERKQSQERLHATLVQTIEAIVATLEKRDPYTAGHQKRVARLAVAIADRLGWGQDRTEGLRFGALIHDIGKIAVPAEVLNRPGRLNDAEMTLVRMHSQEGVEIVQGVEFPWPVVTMIGQHHERMDGGGYPLKLKGEQIILEARVLAVADVVEAMASHRPYRPAVGLDRALDEISAGRGRIYDPQVADACLYLFQQGAFSFAEGGD